MTTVAPGLGTLPELDIDCSAVASAAAQIRTHAADLRSRMDDIEATWAGLPLVLDIAGTDPLYSSLRSAGEVNDDYVDAMVAAADAVDDFAATVVGLQAERDLLAGEIRNLRAAEAVSVASAQDEGVTTGMSPALIEVQAGQLRAEASDLIRRFEQAEDDCVTALHRIDGGHGYSLAPPAAVGGLGIATVSGMPAWTSQQNRFEQAIADRTMSTLTLLAAMSESEQRDWLWQHPEFTETTAELPPAADRVAAWWHTLGGTADTASSGQLALTATAPALIGNLDGVAYWARDRANRAVLDERMSQLEKLEKQLTTTSETDTRSWVERRGDWLAQLTKHGYDEASYEDAVTNTREIQRALGLSSDIPPFMLVSLDDSNPALAAIAIGDLDIATHASYLVSGMYSSSNDMTGAVDEALAVQNKTSLTARQQGIPAEVATVAWIGYDSPDAVTVTRNEHAEAGATRLERALAGYTATQSARGADPLLTVGAHSYGSTVSMLALREDLGVDAFAMYGSAGADGVDDVRDLEVPTGQVYVTETADDPWAPIGRGASGRYNPDSDLFGARAYGSDGGGTDPETGEDFTPSHGHSEYLAQGGEGIRNLAYIGLGLGDQVTED